MNSSDELFVPKIHPATRGVEQDDPMEMLATAVAGDPEIMLECLVTEYASMGWHSEQILSLFKSPDYPMLHALLEAYGEPVIRERIGAVVDRSGVFCCEGVVIDGPELEEEEELIQIGLPAQWKANSHAQGI